MPRSAPATLALLLALAPALAAPSRAAPPGAHKLTAQGRLRLGLARLQPGPPAPRLGCVVRFQPSPPPAAALARLAQRGVTFGGRLGPWRGATATPDGLRALLADPAVAQVLPPAPHAVAPLPPDAPRGRVHALTTADVTWPRRDAQGRRATGQGLVIADLDDGVAVFHPLLFRGDGGYYGWRDLDGDGALTPGVDAVDLDGDGLAEGTLALLDVGLSDLWLPDQVAGLDGAFTPGHDWLYVDLDGDGRRGAGALDGFDDAAPALGEPLFAADDVDHDGALGLDEKLIRLGTSKIRGIYRLGTGNTFLRGDRLAEHVYADGSHGTGVAGILVGGLLGATAVQGVAPDAELVTVNLYAGGDSWGGAGDLVSAADFARGLGARVMIHEYGSPWGEFGDGSGPWEQIIDELDAAGVVQVAATHNFAGAYGNASAVLAAGESAEVTLHTYADPGGGSGTYLLGTLRWQAPAGEALVAQLLPPAPAAAIALAPGEVAVDDLFLQIEADTSPRDTAMVAFYAVRLAADGALAPLGEGEWRLQLLNPSAAPVTWWLAVSDESGYAQRVDVLDDVTDAGTMAHPSTADNALSVGASVGNSVDDGEVPLGLKRFSGRGPRIDGATGIDVVAPEDPFSAAFSDPVTQAVHVAEFGGTSGALPQVGGAIALLLQAHPALAPADVRGRVRDASASDALTGVVPNADWGFGRLATHRLVWGEEPPPNLPPVARAVAPDAVWQGLPAALDASSSSDPDHPLGALRFAWDVDYDGVWDHVAVGDPVHRVAFGSPGRHVVKLAVEDPLGWTDEVLLPVVVGAGPPPAPDPGPETKGPGGDLGGGPADAGGAELRAEGATPGALADDGCGGCGGGAEGGGAALGLLLLLGLGVRARA